jgi:hypothetical protein
MENIVDSCADKGCRASVIRNIESTTTSKRSTFAAGSLENRRKEREHAHVQASKTLKDMHTKYDTSTHFVGGDVNFGG